MILRMVGLPLALRLAKHRVSALPVAHVQVAAAAWRSLVIFDVRVSWSAAFACGVLLLLVMGLAVVHSFICCTLFNGDS